MTKYRSQAEQAQRWFEALSALDQHAGVRAELLAEQVPEHTATALYGSVSDGVLATLAERYAAEGCKAGAQFADWNALLRDMGEISKRLPAAELAEFDREIEAELGRPEFNALAKSLTPHLRQRHAWTHRLPRLQLGTDAALTLWFAHRTMTRRATLARKNQNRVDQLMVWVGRNLLPASFELEQG